MCAIRSGTSVTTWLLCSPLVRTSVTCFAATRCSIAETINGAHPKGTPLLPTHPPSASTDHTTLGSAVWVINGFFSWLPVSAPWTEFAGETSTGSGATALVGATIFEIGSVLLMLEAVNENRADCFGWALEEAWEDRRRGGRGGGWVAHPVRAECRHHHHGCRRSLLGRVRPAPGADGRADGGEGGGAAGAKDGVDGRGEEDPRTGRRWLWMPSWYELRTHYFREIGFLACLSQMIGATVFWISGFTALSPILNSLSKPAEYGVFWLPQVRKLLSVQPAARCPVLMS